MEAIIFVGLQAAGKSTFYRERFFTSHLRISLDMLRTRRRERTLVAWCIAHRQHFVVDNTNPTAAERAVYIAPARAAGFRVIGYVFAPDVAGSLARNAGRPAAERVPAKAIGGTKHRLEWPRREEGFDEIFSVQVAPGSGFLIEEWHDAV